MDGAEIIGWDPARNAYVTQYFGSDGANTYEAILQDDGGVLVWTMRSRSDRFEGTFSANGHMLEGHWEQLDSEKNWQPWMDVWLTRQQSEDPRTTG